MTASNGAVIGATRIAAAHDGSAELIVELRYEGGGRSEVVLDEAAAEALMVHCEAGEIDELIGHGWDKVKAALMTGWNRYN